MFDVPALIAYFSTFTELVPGDVIVIGVLRNPVTDEVAAAATRAA